MPKSRVKALMKEQGFTVRALAAQTDLTEQTIMKARSDDKVLTCRMNTLAKIAKTLGVEVDELFEAGGKRESISEFLKLSGYNEAVKIPDYLRQVAGKSEEYFEEGQSEDSINFLHRELSGIVEFLRMVKANL